MNVLRIAAYRLYFVSVMNDIQRCLFPPKNNRVLCNKNNTNLHPYIMSYLDRYYRDEDHKTWDQIMFVWGLQENMSKTLSHKFLQLWEADCHLHKM